MHKNYEHTQVGYLTITAFVAAMILMGVIIAFEGLNIIALIVLVILAIALVLFSSITVMIQDQELKVRFGPGIIHKNFRLTDIESSQVVRNHWYYGWGIRVTPNGLLYSVSGFHAVEIKLRNGSQFRIGTDVPQELNQAIEQSIQ